MRKTGGRSLTLPSTRNASNWAQSVISVQLKKGINNIRIYRTEPHPKVLYVDQISLEKE